MFGYVKPYIPLLRVKDNEVYRSLYCGVCQSLLDCFGRLSTATLSYDVTFLAVVRLALCKESFTITKKKCTFNPFKRCMIAKDSRELDFSAAVGVILTYYKVLDTKNDERGAAKFAASLLLPLASRKRKKVVKRYGEEADKIIADGINALSELEKENIKSIDIPSDTFGTMLGKLAAYGLEGEKALIARNAGECIGKWIYTVDAIDDAEKDLEKGRYNPIVALYGRTPASEEYTNISITLNATLMKLSAALDLIDYSDANKETSVGETKSVSSTFSDELKAIIENTVCVGMPRVLSDILSKKHPTTTDASLPL